MFLRDDYFASGSFAGEAKPLVLDPHALTAAEIRADTTLIVVDMLTGEQAANSELLLQAVERQITRARKMGWAVLFLSTEPWRRGNVYPRLLKLVDGYAPRCFTRVKAFDNGCVEVMEACFDFNYPTDMFRVCGVNTDLCVRSTVAGLLKLFPHAGFRIIKEACASYTRVEQPFFVHEDPHGHWLWFEQARASTPQLCVSSEAVDREFLTLKAQEKR
ncbi:MAG: cysteine hydrolase [Candidatus Obscuribacterales bacterium]|jgi:hypothetical protein|nr:cysteine hydrolase [Candidatus Obscuribacterales bacterium]